MNQSALQPIWNWLLTELRVGFFAFPLYFLPVVVAVVLVTGVFFSILDVAVFHKIPAATAWRDGLRVMSTYVGSAALLLVLNAKFHPWSLDVPSAAPTLVTFAVQVALFMVIGEFLTYWWHRLEHGSKFVFKYVHYKHHQVDSPLTIWTNFVVHPVEGLMVMLCLYVPPLVLGVHPMVMVAYAVANTTAMVVTHCGYDVRFYPRWLLPPASGHELHHTEKQPTNLSVVMSFGDKFFGTYKNPIGVESELISR
ncbi:MULTISPECIES: sterol desaturase family protein [unclassified Mycobacterium]|uniref:sterol desaturase family protein n=1 Tax=unclassified Mycobacterium TaxID=2642494 RepID=UPI0029C7E28E|nr:MULTISPECIES: sterol desaturase family protein [unclassified Mycobacterium]